MARRYLGNRNELGDEVLRQRRDLYALAIGLSVFNLAGGTMAKGATLGGFLAVSLSNPNVLLCAAWAGFIYFWWRFWQVSEARPIDDFLEEVRLQAGDSKAIRSIAIKHVGEFHNVPRHTLVHNVERPEGLIPKVKLTRAELDLNELYQKRHRGKSVITYTTVGPSSVVVEPKDRWKYWGAILRGYPKAIWLERSFADYTAPHIVAIFTVLLGIWRLLEPAPTANLPLAVVAPATTPSAIKTAPEFSCEHQKVWRSDSGKESWANGYGSYYACRPTRSNRKPPAQQH